jgi:hypothetical protein
MTHPTVLLPATHRDISSSLARYGYEVLTASDPTEAHGFLRANRSIGVLVADVDRGGLILAREARAIRPDLGVVYRRLRSGWPRARECQVLRSCDHPMPPINSPESSVGSVGASSTIRSRHEAYGGLINPSAPQPMK